MGEDKSAARGIVFGNLRKKQRLSASGRTHDQLAAEFVESLDRGGNRLALIRAEREIYRFAVRTRLDRAGSQHDVLGPPQRGGVAACPLGRLLRLWWVQARRNSALDSWAALRQILTVVQSIDTLCRPSFALGRRISGGPVPSSAGVI